MATPGLPLKLVPRVITADPVIRCPAAIVTVTGCAAHANASEPPLTVWAAPFRLVTDTIPQGERRPARLELVSVAPLLAHAIRNIHRSESVSSLFE